MADSKEIITPSEFGQELIPAGNMSSIAEAAADAKEIEVRAIMAERHPRNIDVFEQKLLGYCNRAEFAEAALYAKKVGRVQNDAGEWMDNIAVNFSIRFIEAAITLFKNVDTSMSVIHDDADRVRIKVKVTDLENNATHRRDAVLSKLVERRELKDRVRRGERMNSKGERVFIVEATKDEMRNVIGAETSKLLRDLGQKLLPFHILVAARKAIDAMNETEQKKDPDAAKKKVLSRFASVGVSAEMLTDYLGRALDTLTLQDLAELAVLFNGLKDGEIVWADVMRVKNEPAESEVSDAPGPPKRSKLKDQILEARARKSKTKEGGDETK